jgi:hypothetical protein
MKVSTEHFAAMKAAITMPHACPNERQRWDALWAAVDGERLPWAVLSDYQDSHIDTALRRIGRAS